MQDKICYVETKNRKYPICFNLNVMEEIQEKYGSLEEWGKIVQQTGEPKIKDLKVGLLAMINEAIDIENEESEIKISFITEKQLGRIITEIGIEEIANKIKEITIKSTKTDDEPKNE